MLTTERYSFRLLSWMFSFLVEFQGHDLAGVDFSVEPYSAD